MNLVVNPEFRDKIPPLSPDEFSKLEENILADGEVREPLVVWDGTIIDGHHRWKIIQKHPEIPYKVKQMSFPDKYAAIVWMCKNQIGRRNISDEQRTVLIGEAYKAQKMSRGGDRKSERFSSPQNEDLKKRRVRTCDKVAGALGVSRSTVERAEQFLDGLNAAEEIVPGFKDAVLTGDIKVKKGEVAAIKNVPEPERPAVVESILLGGPAKRKCNNPAGYSKEDRTRKAEIAQIVAEMYDADNYPKYGIAELVSEVKVNAEAYIRQTRRTAEIRRCVISESAENKKAFVDALSNFVVAEIIKIMEEIENA